MRTKDEIVRGMTADIGDTPDNEDVVEWLRREIHACLQEAINGTYESAEANLHSILIMRAMAHDMGVEHDLAMEFDDPTR